MKNLQYLAVPMTDSPRLLLKKPESVDLGLSRCVVDIPLDRLRLAVNGYMDRMKSRLAKKKNMGLSENRVSPLEMDYHHHPYENSHIWGGINCSIFNNTHTVG